jgi:cytochrome P450
VFVCDVCLQFPYIEAVVREALRLYPPATILNRRVKAGGFVLTRDIVVPEGVGVFPFLYGYQRSPEYWPAAEEFRPERWLPDGKHLAPTTPDAWTPFGRWEDGKPCVPQCSAGCA